MQLSHSTPIEYLRRTLIRYVPKSLGLLLIIPFLLLGTGCPSNSSSKPATTTKSSSNMGRGDAPPLIIGLLDGVDLETELTEGWQAFSDQRLQFVKISRQELANYESIPTLDVVIYPANLLGSLAEQEWLATVTPALIDKVTGAKRKPGNAIDEADEPSTGYETWSNRWRSIAKQGGKTLAIPLGGPCWVATMRGLDDAPLRELHQAIISSQNSAQVASSKWEAFVTRAEETHKNRLASNLEDLNKRLSDRSSIDKRAVVNRFLWIMASSESRYRGLFDAYKMTARINLPDFVRNAKLLHRLAVLEPSTALGSPDAAWESVAEGRASFGIGWPRTDGYQRAESFSKDQPLVIAPFLYNSAEGLLVSVSRKTRQSSTASDFIAWISSEDVRVSLQRKTPLVEVLDIDNDKNRVREDYREYQTLQRLEASNISLDLTPRFIFADTMIDLLGDALLDILQKPETAEARLLACKQEWDKLVIELGKERIRGSIEATTGASK